MSKASNTVVVNTRWDALYLCPHHPQGRPGFSSPYVMDCDCRKPKPGLLLRAAQEMQVDLKSSWMIGDGLNDVQAGNSAGCRTVLVTNLKLEQIERFTAAGAIPDRIVPHLLTPLNIS